MPVSTTKRRRKTRAKSLWRRLIGACFLLSILGAAGAVAGYFYLAADLPVLNELRDYKPPIITEVYSDDGTLIAEFGTEKRRIVPMEEIPEHAKWAFVAAEDKRFYAHKGVDFRGIVRAFMLDVRKMELSQGASTISMQVARIFFLNRQKNFTRKLKEAILAQRIERQFNKEEILYLYLNQVDMGGNYFGIGAASEYYFGKPARELTLGESAMLAGLLPAPNRYNPAKSFDLARFREKIVLNILVQEGWITDEQRREALKQPIKVAARRGPQGEAAPYYTAHVRRILAERYGQDRVYQDGLKVFTAVNIKADRTASNAVRDKMIGRNGVDRSIGYRLIGEKKVLGPDEAKKMLEEQEDSYRRDWKERAKEKRLAEGKTAPLFTGEKDLKVIGAMNLPFPELEMLSVPDPAPLEPGGEYEAVVAKVDDKNFEVWVLTGHSKGRIEKADLKWAAPYKAKQSGNTLDKPSRILSPGEKVSVKVKGSAKDHNGEPVYAFTLEQKPAIQAALISMSTRDGHVKALVGGIDFEKYQFIIPVQGQRQSGSCFKPFVYARALDYAGENPQLPSMVYTPATILVDTAMVFNKGARSCDTVNTEYYSPRNYDGTFLGPMTLQQAVAQSRNTTAVRVAWDTCLEDVVDSAHNLGITSPLHTWPSMALGTEEISLEQLAAAFNVFAAGGFYLEPRYILRVYDRDGNLLEYEEETKPGEGQPAPVIGDTIGPSAGSTAAALAESDVPEDARFGLPSRNYHILENPTRPADVGELGWEDFLARIRDQAHPWIPPVTAPALSADQRISAQTAYIMNYILRTVVTEGTAQAASSLPHKVVGKTGTTNDYRDALFVGYSPELLAAVWVGAEKGYFLGRGASGGKVALPIWIAYMKEMLAGRPAVAFPIPPGIVWADVDIDTGLLAAEYTDPKKRRTYPFKRGTAPIEISPPPAFDPMYGTTASGVAPISPVITAPDSILDDSP